MYQCDPRVMIHTRTRIASYCRHIIIIQHIHTTKFTISEMIHLLTLCTVQDNLDITTCDTNTTTKTFIIRAKHIVSCYVGLYNYTSFVDGDCIFIRIGDMFVSV